jgi:hypothetical protein
MGCKKHTWFNRFIIFSRLNIFYYYSINENSTHVCRKINELKKNSCQKNMFFNIPKNYVFSLTKTFSLKKNEYYNFLANHVINVKDAKVLH